MDPLPAALRIPAPPRIRALVDATERSLLDRLEPDGYTETSLTGDYSGMYVRDAAAQVLAMLAGDHDEVARRILLFVGAAAADAERAPHVIERGGVLRMTDQPDGSAFLALAAARFLARHPGDDAVAAFAGGPAARWATAALAPPYRDGPAALIRNPNLEHSRELHYWNARDLLTNVVHAEALAALAEVVPAHADAPRWASAARELEAAVHRELVVGTPTPDRPDTAPPTAEHHAEHYAELYDDDHGGRLLPGFSWVSLAPVAVQWRARRRALEAATYDAYLATAAEDWGGIRMLSAYDDVIAVTGEDEVIGKGLAWELRLAAELGRRDRAAELLAFVERETPGELYAESFYADHAAGTRHVSDAGNQEQASWFVAVARSTLAF